MGFEKSTHLVSSIPSEVPDSASLSGSGVVLRHCMMATERVPMPIIVATTPNATIAGLLVIGFDMPRFTGLMVLLPIVDGEKVDSMLGMEGVVEVTALAMLRGVN
jgi:hypothetical protein